MQLLRYGFEALGFKPLRGDCLTYNKGSYRVLEKLGFTFLGVRSNSNPRRQTTEDMAFFELKKRVDCEIIIVSSINERFGFAACREGGGHKDAYEREQKMMVFLIFFMVFLTVRRYTFGRISCECSITEAHMYISSLFSAIF